MSLITVLLSYRLNPYAVLRGTYSCQLNILSGVPLDQPGLVIHPTKTSFFQLPLLS